MNPLAPNIDNPPNSSNRPNYRYEPLKKTFQPVVSIVTPFYNSGDTFHETADTVFRQTLQQWEWLIVNDGSDDSHSQRVLTEFNDRDPRIRVINLPTNKGLPKARNIGAAQAQGKYLFWLDADDLLEPTALEKMAWYLESYPEFAFCKGYTVAFGEQRYLSEFSFEAGNLFLNRNPVTTTALVRSEVFHEVGGFDESFVSGLEDWDFWLRCAEHGYWGHGIPEYFDWYRRRLDHSDRWANWREDNIKKMRSLFRARYPKIFRQGIPAVKLQPHTPYQAIRTKLPFGNPLKKVHSRILMILPWLTMGGADHFNLNLVEQLSRHNYQITIATTLPNNYQWYWQFAQYTPDIHILPNIVRPIDYPRFLHYLIRSRQPDIVFISNSEIGYPLLPYLRTQCPNTVFVDYCHMEEEHWNNGGHPRSALAYQDVLDMNIVSSLHLKAWMIDRGGNPDRIQVAYTNVDTRRFRPDPEMRRTLREAWKISEETPVILYSGRICAQKQPRVFANVMKNLRDQGINFYCIVAGDGEERRWLARFLRRHKLTDRVWLLGAMTIDEIREVLTACDIYFLPSQMEGISLAIYEAMATGLTVVGADVGGQVELVTPDRGFLIQRGTEQEEIEQYTAILADLLRSPEQRERMGQAAHKAITSFYTLDKMTDRMLTLFQQAKQQHSRRHTQVMSQSLTIEHIVQALEIVRLSTACTPLFKYSKIESFLSCVMAKVFPIATRAQATIEIRFIRFHQLFRQFKDLIWIIGHRIKVRLGLTARQTNVKQ